MDLPRKLGLSEEEAKKIRKLMRREPNFLEWGIFSLNWSEHCSYKTSRSILRMLPREGNRVLIGPGENAGVVELGKGWCVVFKVESHNHPSAVEPVHGAATGIGGIVRDILSLGARPIALLDSLRFGEIENPKARYLFEGVVQGISFYGNSIGVPTVGGDVYFDDAYLDNPLVNVMCVGLVRKEKLKRAIAEGEGNLILLIGAPTGRDGIHGATFASEDLIGDRKEKRVNVQIGDPFMGKLLIEAILEVADDPGVIGIQDLGAGGLSTAPPEMAKKGGFGVEIDIEKVPLRAEGMSPYEIILSESQERMILCVKPEAVERIRKKVKKWGLEAEVIGRLMGEPIYRVVKKKEILADIPLRVLLDEVIERKGEDYGKYGGREDKSIKPALKKLNIKDGLLKLLSSPNLCSREWVYTQYDHTVQINTVFVPGSADAALLRVKGEQFGIALTMDGNGRYTFIDPYEGGKIAVCEARRNIISVGAEPLGITDCLNFANPEDPEVYNSFYWAVKGMADALRVLEIPVVSGNVSFYNQSEERKVYPTVVVGMVGYLEDIEKRMTPGFKGEGDRIYMVGKQKGDIGGSEFLKVFYGIIGGKLDSVDLEFEKRLGDSILELIRRKLIESAHDISEGGLLVALSECSMWGKRGAHLYIEGDEEFLFGEWQSRYIVTVRREKEEVFLDHLKNSGIPFLLIGEVTGKSLRIQGFDIPISEMEKVYREALKNYLR
jgi:phosphoribosylformylglycinamidine synthase